MHGARRRLKILWELSTSSWKSKSASRLVTPGRTCKADKKACLFSRLSVSKQPSLLQGSPNTEHCIINAIYHPLMRIHPRHCTLMGVEMKFAAENLQLVPPTTACSLILGKASSTLITDPVSVFPVSECRIHADMLNTGPTPTQYLVAIAHREIACVDAGLRSQ